MSSIDRRRLDLVRDRRGVAYLEFLIAFLPLWTFALCIFQLALIAQANLLVRHAADAAARAAAVVLPDDPAEYGGEPEMSVARNRFSSDALGGALDAVSSLVRATSTTGGVLSGRALANVGRSRLNTIRLAAHVPLVPLSPLNVGREARPSLRKALRGTRSLVSAAYYQPFAVAVTFPGTSGDFIVGPEVTVRVTYAHQCNVPLARFILCVPFEQLESTSQWEQSFFAVAQALVGGRFREIHHESTALIQDAPYEYQERGS